MSFESAVLLFRITAVVNERLVVRCNTIVSFSSLTAGTSDKILPTSNLSTTSPRNAPDNHPTATASPVSNSLNSSAHSPFVQQMVTRRSPKRRSVSAAVVNSTTIVAVTRQSSRGNRTISASCIPLQSKSSRNRKRSHSSASGTSTSSNKRKKSKAAYHWTLFGKSRQQLVSLHVSRISHTQPSKDAVFHSD